MCVCVRMLASRNMRISNCVLGVYFFPLSLIPIINTYSRKYILAFLSLHNVLLLTPGHWLWNLFRKLSVWKFYCVKQRKESRKKFFKKLVLPFHLDRSYLHITGMLWHTIILSPQQLSIVNKLRQSPRRWHVLKSQIHSLHCFLQFAFLLTNEAFKFLGVYLCRTVFIYLWQFLSSLSPFTILYRYIIY